VAFGWEADARTVACDLTTRREVELAAEEHLSIDEMGPPELGEPQDGNTRFLHRVIGHAGLFGDLTTLGGLAGQWLRPGNLLRADSVARALGGPGRFALGWFRQGETQGGRALGPQAFGHEGFTGGSLWSDPETDLTVAVLAHRATVASDLGPFRESLHHLAQRL
jgi:CubicO group peptidase (beta-lactamase class C family)